MLLLIDKQLPWHADAWHPSLDIYRYDSSDDLAALLPSAQGIVCRSVTKLDQARLNAAPLTFVATATSGINHIDVDYLAAQNIPLFNAAGANAGAVVEWVLSTIACVRHQFINEKIGIIGVGHVGSLLAALLPNFGFEPVLYDPYRQDEPDFQHQSISAIQSCAALCIHANLHDKPPYPSYNLVDANFLAGLAPNTVIINAARGGIVNESDLLQSPICLHYCTDVYLNEPAINDAIVNKAVICTPHIAGHTVEAKAQAMLQVCRQIHHHLNLPLPMSAQSNKQPIKAPPPALSTFLAHYDPRTETDALKKGRPLNEAFQQLRSAHYRYCLAIK